MTQMEGVPYAHTHNQQKVRRGFLKALLAGSRQPWKMNPTITTTTAVAALNILLADSAHRGNLQGGEHGQLDFRRTSTARDRTDG